MPYIKKKDRKQYDELVDQLADLVRDYGEQNASSVAGQLNYIITRLILKTYKGYLPNYSDINEIVGVLECAKLEFYRRTAAPYEDKKIKENGDVKA